MSIQLEINALSEQWRKERSQTQMTLGKLIDQLSSMRDKDYIQGFGSPHSYRGYYSDLAFEPSDNEISVFSALEICKSAMGEVFEGYKGCEFQMGRNTPIWMANYGRTGMKIVSLSEDGKFELKEDEY